MNDQTSRTLAYQTLEDAGACFRQRARFRQFFGDSVEVSVELAMEHAAEFDWLWAAENLLPWHHFLTFEQVQDATSQAFQETTNPYYDLWDAGWQKACRAKEEARLAARDRGEDYDAERHAGQVTFEQTMEPYTAALEAVKAITLPKYNRALAVRFAELYIQAGREIEES